MGPYGLEDLNKLLIPLLVLWLVFTVYVVLLLRDFSMNLFKYKTFFSFALGRIQIFNIPIHFCQFSTVSNQSH